jgi:hypothetical protein
VLEVCEKKDKVYKGLEIKKVQKDELAWEARIN